MEVVVLNSVRCGMNELFCTSKVNVKSSKWLACFTLFNKSELV